MYFQVDFGSNELLFLLLYFREVTSDLDTAQLFFKLYISQRYVHNPERNWKNPVCISVRSFTNL